jgi:hypothetical protein
MEKDSTFLNAMQMNNKIVPSPLTRPPSNTSTLFQACAGLGLTVPRSLHLFLVQVALRMQEPCFNLVPVPN